MLEAWHGLADLLHIRGLDRSDGHAFPLPAFGEDGARSIPTPEHYLPLLYVIALQKAEDRVVFLTDGIELGSISMMSVAIGAT